jgi:hypothetical protein
VYIEDSGLYEIALKVRVELRNTLRSNAEMILTCLDLSSPVPVSSHLNCLGAKELVLLVNKESTTL